MLTGHIAGVEKAGVEIELPGGAKLVLTVEVDTVQLNETVTLGIRPEGLRPDPAGALSGVVSLIERLGALSLLYIDLDQGTQVIAQISGGGATHPHQRIRLAIDASCCHVFDDTGRALAHCGRPLR